MTIEYGRYYYVSFGYSVCLARCILASAPPVFSVLTDSGYEIMKDTKRQDQIFGEVKDIDLPFKLRFSAWLTHLPFFW